jgi:hypothetical protein
LVGLLQQALPELLADVGWDLDQGGRTFGDALGQAIGLALIPLTPWVLEGDAATLSIEGINGQLQARFRDLQT